jgi:cytochrome c-type biogenesis protein CcmH/NrfG
MARGAAKQRSRSKAEARPRAPRKPKPPVAEQTMFFMRLRRSTKPIFLFLALVFALTFVFLGVGSGSAGVGDLLGDLNLFGGGSSVTSVGKAQERVRKHPSDPAAYRDLAHAYEAKNDEAKAIDALNGYLRLRPKDASVLSELAALQLGQAETARQQALVAQAAVTQGSLYSPAVGGKLGSALGQNPITEASTARATAAFTAAYQKMQGAYAAAVDAYRRVAAQSPSDPSVQLQLADAAETAGDTKTAVAAYKRFLKLAPDDPQGPTVRERIKLLKSSTR